MTTSLTFFLSDSASYPIEDGEVVGMPDNGIVESSIVARASGCVESVSWLLPEVADPSHGPLFEQLNSVTHSNEHVSSLSLVRCVHAEFPIGLRVARTNLPELAIDFHWFVYDAPPAITMDRALIEANVGNPAWVLGTSTAGCGETLGIEGEVPEGSLLGPVFDSADDHRLVFSIADPHPEDVGRWEFFLTNTDDDGKASFPMIVDIKRAGCDQGQGRALDAILACFVAFGAIRRRDLVTDR